MTKEMNAVLKKVLGEITMSDENIDYINQVLIQFKKLLNARLKKLKINAELFVGGSFAKNTLVKKSVHDVDLFLRFDKKYSEKEIVDLSKKIFKKIKGVSIVHGSRDYFKIKVNDWLYFEIVPVLKIKKSGESKNITDLSYSHVKYINEKIKSKKILDEIKLAKAFCSGAEVYGAESYVNGFSGYAVELLIIYFKTFEKFLKELSKDRKEKLIIDIEKYYKNANEILNELNGSKLISPIVLIDPTYKERNVLAALSTETYDKFRETAKAFLKKPNEKFFFPKKINLDELKEKVKKEGKDFIFLKFKTDKQAGDIAGTKLLKFHKHLILEISKYFLVKEQGFKYSLGNEGKSYFVLIPKKEIIYFGPLANDEKNASVFKSIHKNIFEKNKKIYAREKGYSSAKEFFSAWIKNNKKKIKSMYISEIQFN